MLAWSCCESCVWLADLLALWQAHGTGLVAKHALLHFQDGALTAPSPASGSFEQMSCLSWACCSLRTTAFCSNCFLFQIAICCS